MIFGRNKEKNQNSGNNNYSNNSNNSNNYYNSDRYSRGSDYSRNNNGNYYDWNLNDSSDNSDSNSQGNYYDWNLNNSQNVHGSSENYPSRTSGNSETNNNQSNQYNPNSQQARPVSLNKNNPVNLNKDNPDIDKALPHLHADGTPRRFHYTNYSEYDIPENFNAKESNSKITGCFFLLWFFGSMLLMLLVAERYPALTISIFGQIFLFLGIYLVKRSKELISKIIMYGMNAIGAACVLLGIIQTFGTSAVKSKATEVFLFLGLLLFLAIGVGMLVLPAYNAKLQKQKCSYSVTAYVVKVRSRIQNRKHLKAPVYQYVYNGVTYRQSSNLYTSGREFPHNESESVTLLIDPENPDDFYEIGREKYTITFFTIFGIFWTLMSLFATVVFIQNTFIH